MNRRRLHAARTAILSTDDSCCMEIRNSLRPRIDARQRNEFGWSYRSFLLYAQCVGAGLRAPGLFFETERVACAVGLYEHYAGLAAHIVCPVGPDWLNSVREMSLDWLHHRIVDRVYVRQLTSRRFTQLCSVGFKPSSAMPWLPCAHAEDETYNHRLAVLGTLIEEDPKGLRVRDLDLPGSKNYRRKLRQSISRFENFLRNNRLAFELRRIASSRDLRLAGEIVREHFDFLEAGAKRVGSTADDYTFLLEDGLADGQNTLSEMAWLLRDRRTMPIGVFLGERVGVTRGGLYLTIVRRGPAIFDGLAIETPRGFTAIGQYVWSRMFFRAWRMGWREVDVGGSETESLDNFKRQLGCQECPTRWAVLGSL